VRLSALSKMRPGSKIVPLLLMCGGLLVIGAFWAAGVAFQHGWLLDLGSFDFPAPLYARFVGAYTFTGLIAAVMLAVGMAMLVSGADPRGRTDRILSAGSDVSWVAVAAGLAFLVPVMIRAHVLQGMPLTDDEGCYRFSAQLLASGRLYAPSPPMKLFFDRVFVINDGHFYTQYPLGWPLLMVPGLLVGLSGYMNAVYAALTIPPLFLVIRRHIGSRWARLGAILWVLAPFLMIGAATELSHTSCVMALAWAWWLALRSRDRGSVWPDALCATMLGLAFTIRPAVGASLGGAITGIWAWGLVRRPGNRARRLVAFALPALVMASLFLGVNAAQTGSPFELAYTRWREYARENNYRFSDIGPSLVPELQFADLSGVASGAVAAAWRFDAALFGWPLSLIFVPLAGRRRGAGQGWAAAAGFLGVHAFVGTAGIDSFGPVHFYELGLPAVVLTVHGVRRATAWARWIESRRCATTVRRYGARGVWRLLPLAGVVAFTALSLSCYVPVRARALMRVTSGVRLPLEMVKSARLKAAIIFSPAHYWLPCVSWPTKGFVYWPPMNDPDFVSPVLWANHISGAQDRALMHLFPGRTGYVMAWTERCRPILLPLDDPRVDKVQSKLSLGRRR
jgi:hypothetical protein